jgi:tyrosinase
MARKTTAASGKGKSESRYARVVAILDAAAADSKADYGGAGRFWDGDLDAFEKVSVYGVRMIAPAVEASCCGEGGGRSRSERSGLIQGLRGEPPFDGRRFPPLPWGGKQVDDTDIAFIADWIDDGCPASDDAVTEIAAPQAESDARQVQLADVKEFGVMEWPDWIASRPGTPRQRGNLDCMSETQLDRLRAAFRCIYDLDQHTEDRRNYNNQALIHQNHCQHGWERFLPWHRAYLYEFEQNLQDFFPNVTLPYWDWTLPNYQPDAKPRDLIPRSFQAYLTMAEATNLVDKLRPRPNDKQEAGFLALAENGVRFTSQRDFFDHVVDTIGYPVTPSPDDPRRTLMIKALLASNALWYPLRYPGEYAGGKSVADAFRMHFPSAEDMAEILSLNNFRDFGGGSVYDAAFGFLDQNPHNTMHIWTGGENPNAELQPYGKTTGKLPAPQAAAAAGDPATAAARRNAMARVAGRKFHLGEDLRSQPQTGDMLSNLTASYDPIFWPIHVNIDRVWCEWQKLNPNALPADLDSILSPWNYTIRNTLDIAPFGYEYVRGSFFMPVGLEAPVARFVSKPIKLDAAAKGFRKAEVRLHWVPQLMRSCFVRAFLNQPGADATTELQGNPHFAGYLAIFGHGACYGGPGHCDPPPPRPRDYDLRTRSHNTPRNHRIDVTKAAKHLLQKTDRLQITLLVIGADYQEDHELLKLEGVSLNLLD